MISKTAARMFPDGYWPSEMDSGAQYRSIDDFSKAIYPIWMGIEKKDFEAEAKMSLEELRAVPVMLECSTIHKQDLAIHASGIKPHKSSVAAAAMANLRKKAVRAAGSWSGGE